MSSQRKFTFAISSPDEFLVFKFYRNWRLCTSPLEPYYDKNDISCPCHGTFLFSDLPDFIEAEHSNIINVMLKLAGKPIFSVAYYTWFSWPCIKSITKCDKKLIRRWDSERELSLRRHRTRTKNTIDSCVNSATDRFLQRRFTKFSEITHCNGHYAVHGQSRSPILVPIESSYTTSY